MSIKVRILIGLIIIGLGVAAAYWWQVVRNNSEAEKTLVLYGNVDIREVRLAFNGGLLVRCTPAR